MRGKVKIKKIKNGKSILYGEARIARIEHLLYAISPYTRPHSQLSVKMLGLLWIDDLLEGLVANSSFDTSTVSVKVLSHIQSYIRHIHGKIAGPTHKLVW